MLRLPTVFTLAFSKTWGRRQDGEGNYMILASKPSAHREWEAALDSLMVRLECRSAIR